MENQQMVEGFEKRPGKNTIGIVSLVFAGVSLIGSWIPLLNVISMIFGIAAIITGIVSFILVLAKKVSSLMLPITGIVLSVISLVLASSVNNAVSDSLSGKSTSDYKVNSYSSSERISSSENSASQSGSNNDASQTYSAATNENNSNVEDKEYKVGDTVSVNGTEITVTNVQRNYTPEYGQAKDGQEFVKVTLKFENKSNKSISANSLDFKIQDGNGVIEGDHIDGYSMDDYFNASQIAPNGTKTGSIVFEVPKDDKNLTFIYEPNLFSDKQVKIKL